MFKFFKTYQRRQATIRELNRLNDRELHDIGISRHDIKTLSRSI